MDYRNPLTRQAQIVNHTDDNYNYFMQLLYLGKFV